jgi:hypothetical protein
MDGELMFVLKEARRAMLAAYRSALTQGVPHEVAVDTAMARYRAFVPAASSREVRAVLEQAISADAASTQARRPELVH